MLKNTPVKLPSYLCYDLNDDEIKDFKRGNRSGNLLI